MNRLTFFLDEHIPNAVANGLRNRGIDVLTIHQAGRRGLPDIDQLAYANQHGRMIVTCDDDFVRLAAQNAEHAGIVYFKLQTRTVKEVIRGLVELYERFDAGAMVNIVWFL